MKLPLTIHKKEFYFVRHGEIDYPLYFSENSDEIPLNSNGIRQAEDIKTIIESLPIHTICYSPIRRAQETKNIIARDLSCQQFIVEDLSECSLEVWNAMVALETGLLSAEDVICSEVMAFFKRAIDGINRALSFPGPVLIVAHGGIHWAMCHHMEIEHTKKIGNCIPIHFALANKDQWKANVLVS